MLSDIPTFPGPVAPFPVYCDVVGSPEYAITTVFHDRPLEVRALQSSDKNRYRDTREL